MKHLCTQRVRLQLKTLLADPEQENKTRWKEFNSGVSPFIKNLIIIIININRFQTIITVWLWLQLQVNFLKLLFDLFPKLTSLIWFILYLYIFRYIKNLKPSFPSSLCFALKKMEFDCLPRTRGCFHFDLVRVMINNKLFLFD